ncbi:hypothetical protein ACFWUZ_09520 [Streptomyces sp. NPDC058646]|uniref:hypothetical protein n=1 Tax=Streptomyces sp. NPDC058646 TaxID=3346574 RepID=UPI0036602B71
MKPQPVRTWVDRCQVRAGGPISSMCWVSSYRPSSAGTSKTPNGYPLSPTTSPSRLSCGLPMSPKEPGCAKWLLSPCCVECSRFARTLPSSHSFFSRPPDTERARASVPVTSAQKAAACRLSAASATPPREFGTRERSAPRGAGGALRATSTDPS